MKDRSYPGKERLYPDMESPSMDTHNGIDDLKQSESAVGLLKRLLNEVSDLFRKEIALAKMEAAEALSHVKTGAISMAAGGAVLFGGIVVLLAAVVLVLALWLPAWLAALIVGGIVTVTGYVMVQAGKKTFEVENIKPNRTQEALRQDKAMLERRMT